MSRDYKWSTEILYRECKKMEKQRDQLAEALREMLDQFDAEECTRNEADYMAVKKARAALKALERGDG